MKKPAKAPAKTNGKSLKRSYSELESLDVDDWQEEGKNQPVMTKQYCKIEPVQKISEFPVQLDFYLTDPELIWVFNENTYFRIQGTFQSRAKAENVWGPWTNVEPADSANVILQPYWIGGLVRGFESYYGYNKINTSEEGGFVSAYTDTFKLAHMDKEQKKKLCYDPCHPGNGVPVEKNDWTIGTDTAWQKYSKTVFLGAAGKVMFNWVPLDSFPLFQGCNYLEGTKALPLSKLKHPLNLRIFFHDHPEYIFKKKAGNEKEYRFLFEEFSLCVEKVKLSESFKKNYLAKTQIDYPGVTRLVRQETVPTASTIYKSTIQEIAYPEGILVAFVNKEVVTGTYKYQSNTTGDVFLPHNITSIKFKYGGKPFFTESPDLGMLTLNQMETRLISDYRNFPPFGMKFNMDTINSTKVSDGWKSSVFPHAFINLCLNKYKDRYIPLYDKGEVLDKNPVTGKYENLELDFTFTNEGSPADSTMLIYLYYTDCFLTLDMPLKKDPSFYSEYLTLR